MTNDRVPFPPSGKSIVATNQLESHNTNQITLIGYEWEYNDIFVDA